MSSGAPPLAPAVAARSANASARTLGRRMDLFVGGLILMLGMAYLASALLGSYVAQGEAARRFTPVVGVIDGAEVVALSGMSPTSSSYAVRLHCRYDWNGQSFVTTTDSFYGSRSVMDLRDATAAAALYEPGTPTQLFVDPDNPSRAVLDNTAPRSALPILLALLMTAASAFLAAVGWRGWPLVVRSTHG